MVVVQSGCILLQLQQPDFETPSNFNWFLHTMLFYHTRNVVEKRKTTEDEEEQNDRDEDDSVNT